MDKLIHYVNLDGRVNAFYSTPALFADALIATNYTFSVKVGLGAPWRGAFLRQDCGVL